MATPTQAGARDNRASAGGGIPRPPKSAQRPRPGEEEDEQSTSWIHSVADFIDPVDPPSVTIRFKPGWVLIGVAVAAILWISYNIYQDVQNGWQVEAAAEAAPAPANQPSPAAEAAPETTVEERDTLTMYVDALALCMGGTVKVGEAAANELNAQWGTSYDRLDPAGARDLAALYAARSHDRFATTPGFVELTGMQPGDPRVLAEAFGSGDGGVLAGAPMTEATEALVACVGDTLTES